MLISNATFVVTDTETTGVSAQRDRVIELAAVKVCGGEVVERFSELVNPERSVPRRITGLTGISTGMVFEAPTMAHVLPRYLDFLGDGVFVAHNLSFDLGFLNAEAARIGLPPLENATLCTLRLARRLLRGLRSKGLAALVKHYRITHTQHHRALGDAEATAQVLQRLISQLGFEQGLTALSELLTYQHTTYSRSKQSPRHVRRIQEEVLPQVPERPGVYFMKDRQERILYIGKAKRLRTRVRTYFTAIEAKEERLRKLVAKVRDVTWEETGSELGALLLESRLIKEHKPLFNRAQRRYRNRPFIRLETTDTYPRVSWTSYLQDDGAEYYGPLGSRRQAEAVVECIKRYYLLRECDDHTFSRGHRCLYADLGQCLAPCEGGEAVPAYAEEVERVRAFLRGQDRTVQERLDVAMRAAAAEMAFEEARSFRDTLHLLERMQDKQQRIAANVLDHHAALVLPGVAQHTVQVLAVRYGRHTGSLTLPATLAPKDLASLQQFLADAFDPAMPRPERYFKREVDEVRLLLHWIYTNRHTTHHVAWEPSEAVQALRDRIERELPRVLAGEQDSAVPGDESPEAEVRV